jgi:hypothetical protein
VRGLLESLKKAFNTYSKSPFIFVWGSLLYLFLFLVFSFAALGIFLIYFLFLAVVGQELNLESIPTVAIFSIIGILFMFFVNGINAALAMAYREAWSKNKVSLTKFFAYAMDRAPTMFGILLIRDVVWLLFVGPFIALYIYALQEYQYLDIAMALYGLFMTFLIHMVFTPSFVLAGAFGVSLYASLKQAFYFMRKKHVYFIGTYLLFAIVWILNYIPFIQLAALFFLYPVIYLSIITMIRNNIKVQEDED